MEASSIGGFEPSFKPFVFEAGASKSFVDTFTYYRFRGSSFIVFVTAFAADAWSVGEYFSVTVFASGGWGLLQQFGMRQFGMSSRDALNQGRVTWGCELNLRKS